MFRRKKATAALPRDEGSRNSTRRLDLQVSPFPVTTPDDWRDPERALQELFEYSEGRDTQISAWYLTTSGSRGVSSQLLRALAMVCGALRGPLIQLLVPSQNAVSLGYAFLLLAATLVAFDKFFGLSAGWMRDISASQEVSRLLVAFRPHWSQLSFKAKADGEANVRKRLQFLIQFNKQIDDVVKLETLAWETEIGALVAQLQNERSAAINTN